MKKATALKCILFATLVVSTFLTGCVRRYTMTLENGTQLGVIGKPTIDGGSYVAKDVNGQTIRIPRSRVREVSPASMSSASNSSGYSAAPQK